MGLKEDYARGMTTPDKLKIKELERAIEIHKENAEFYKSIVRKLIR